MKTFSRDFIVQSVAVESLGALGPSTLTFLSDLGNCICAVHGNNRVGEFLRQRIGIGVQAGNAACIKESFTHNIPVPLREVMF